MTRWTLAVGAVLVLGAIVTVSVARALGYRGISSKSCKGIYKSIVNATRAAKWSAGGEWERDDKLPEVLAQGLRSILLPLSVVVVAASAPSRKLRPAAIAVLGYLDPWLGALTMHLSAAGSRPAFSARARKSAMDSAIGSL